MARVDGIDPHVIAKAQIDRDRARLARVRPWVKARVDLFPHKIDRMTRSPLAFLRGSAALFYDVLAGVPHFAAGPGGEGFIVGDLHLENFGAFRPEPAQTHHEGELDAVFDVNDFDDCAVAPWRFDLLRLTTSLILGGRELGANGRETLELCDALLDAYAAHPRSLPPAPRTVRTLLATVSARSRAELLAARTEVHHAARRFVRGSRYLELVPAVKREAEKAFSAYVHEHVPKARRDALEICDMAFRVAGTGSLGCLRVAFLVTGKGGRDGHWVFDMKEEDAAASVARLVGSKGGPRGAARVEAGLRACLKDVPRGLGVVTLRERSMLVRRLTPQEDKLDLERFPKEELPELARLLGALVARAHLRGRRGPSRSWTRAERRSIVDRAVRLAGVHEAAYLAYCRLAGDATGAPRRR